MILSARIRPQRRHGRLTARYFWCKRYPLAQAADDDGIEPVLPEECGGTAAPPPVVDAGATPAPPPPPAPAAAREEDDSPPDTCGAEDEPPPPPPARPPELSLSTRLPPELDPTAGAASEPPGCTATGVRSASVCLPPAEHWSTFHRRPSPAGGNSTGMGTFGLVAELRPGGGGKRRHTARVSERGERITGTLARGARAQGQQGPRGPRGSALLFGAPSAPPPEPPERGAAEGEELPVDGAHEGVGAPAGDLRPRGGRGWRFRGVLRRACLAAAAPGRRESRRRHSERRERGGRARR